MDKKNFALEHYHPAIQSGQYLKGSLTTLNLVQLGVKRLNADSSRKDKAIRHHFYPWFRKASISEQLSDHNRWFYLTVKGQITFVDKQRLIY